MSDQALEQEKWEFAVYSKTKYGLGHPGPDGGGAFFFVQCRDSTTKDAENIDAMRKIAAAPELLSALEGVLYWACRPGDDGKGDDGYDEARRIARAVIAKARGTKK